jgi:DNA polymerase III subunit epsilon
MVITTTPRDPISRDPTSRDLSRPPMLATQTALDLWDLGGLAPAGTPAWCDAPLAALDLETTGIDPARARILEVALHLEVPDEGARALVDTLVDPGPDVVIPAASTVVHGITRAELADRRAPHPAIVLERLHDALATLAADAVPVVIYNACFDWPMLAAELRRWLPGRSLPRCHLVDPFVLDRHCDRDRGGKRTLAATCAVYGVRLDRAHRAGADCLAALGVARAIGRRFPEVGVLSPAELDALQASVQATGRQLLEAAMTPVMGPPDRTPAVRAAVTAR